MRAHPFQNFTGLCLVVLLSFAARAEEGPPTLTCDCPPLACKPCEVEAGTSFYTAKCGSNFERVKSCKKVKCDPVENQTQCLSLLGTKKPVIEVKKDEADDVRAPADESSHRSNIAHLLDFEGDASVFKSGAKQAEPLRRNQDFSEGDRLKTSTGKIKVRLQDQSEMMLAANSSLVIEKVKVDPAQDRRNIMLKLLSGKVRSRVTRKYSGENTFEVRAGTAVAGVRGTDFLVAFGDSDAKTGGVSTEVRTLDGIVNLRDDTTGGKDINIGALQRASFTVPKDGKGYFTPLMTMKQDDVDEIKSSTEIAAHSDQASIANGSRSPASGEEICAAPSGHYGQCSWTCVGNPKGQSECRVDRPGVSCVRRICDAAGKWSQPTRMPASEKDFCDGTVVKVHECGEYW